MNKFWFFCLLLPALSLPGCSSDTGLPPQRPAGTVSGKVVDGVITDAIVNVYAFNNGTRGRRLGGGRTDTDGNYSLEIRAASQLILIETTGGTYTEQATGTVVTVPAGDVMQAIVPYESGQPVQTMVTPLTHLVAGLTFYKIRQGSSATQALSEAKATIEQFLTIDTSSAIPVDITQSDNTVNALSEEALYGFYLAGISNLSLWASNKNQVTPHTIYTSISITQIMYNDIQADGKLDGVGFDLAHANLMPLAIGIVPLTAETYRAAFSLHLLAVANMTENTTNLKPGDLQQVADDLATKTSALFASADTLDINNQAPLISVPQPLPSIYSGTMTLPLEIGGFLDAASVDISVDGNFVTAVANPQNPEIVIDTTAFPPDGNHILGITATDILGNTATQNITVSFDNTNPVINVTSSPIVNSTSAAISGTYSDNLAGVDTIIIDGHQVTLNPDGTWTTTVTVVPGENIVPINVFDSAGNHLVTQTTVYLDDLNPEINTSNGHSSARFSDSSGGYFTAPLQDTNASTALYITTDRLDLNGVPIVRQQLDSNLIPYFAFTVTDQRTTTLATPFSELQVRVQYEKNGVILSPWHVLPVPSSGTEYLIPIASETLAADWHQASPVEMHNIEVEVSDPAGNTSTTSFSFRADFYVPPLNINNMTVTDLGANIFSATTFANRSTLNNVQFASTQFSTVINPVGTSIYIQPQDTTTHTVQQVVEQLIREHQVRLVTTTQWQIRLLATNITAGCPSDNLTAWQNITSIYNWVNNVWTVETVPAPVPGPVEYAPDDNLPPAPAASPWGNVPHFDNSFNSRSFDLPGSLTRSYNFDYVLSTTSFLPPAAYIANWETRDSVGNLVDTCPDVDFFQQRDVYAYVSEPGFPQPVVSDVTLDGLPGFLTTAFEVFDNDANAMIQPVNGWYNVPAGHSVTITKSVTTPPLVNYNDDISDLNAATYTTPLLYDHFITWSVNREINIAVIHDAGEANTPEMSQQNNSIGSGIVDYQISR